LHQSATPRKGLRRTRSRGEEKKKRERSDPSEHHLIGTPGRRKREKKSFITCGKRGEKNKMAPSCVTEKEKRGRGTSEAWVHKVKLSKRKEKGKGGNLVIELRKRKGNEERILQ